MCRSTPAPRSANFGFSDQPKSVWVINLTGFRICGRRVILTTLPNTLETSAEIA